MNDRKKILLFSRDPGGANTIFPLVGPLEKKGYAVLLYGKDMALKIYHDHGLSGLNINDFISECDREEIESWIRIISPDFIITGTSAYDFTEKHIWHTAKKMNIPSFAILDSWINYGLRFSKYTIFESARYDKNNQHPFLPDKIMVMDEYAKGEMIKEGFDGSRIAVTGHPYFEDLLKMRINFQHKDSRRLRSELGINATDFLITFASEPISITYKEEDGSGLYWGYDEKTILADILKSLKQIASVCANKITLLVKLHPKEDLAHYASHIEKTGTDKINVLFNKETDALKLILSSDLICGMFSMFLTEAAILGKPVISVQTGLKRENPFILDTRDVLKSILTRDELLNQLKEIILEGKARKCNFTIISNPVNRIVQEMEGYLCRN